MSTHLSPALMAMVMAGGLSVPMPSQRGGTSSPAPETIRRESRKSKRPGHGNKGSEREQVRRIEAAQEKRARKAAKRKESA